MWHSGSDILEEVQVAKSMPEIQGPGAVGAVKTSIDPIFLLGVACQWRGPPQKGAGGYGTEAGH